MLTVLTNNTMYCPRCDRPFNSGTSQDATLELVKVHVAGQHPDHDPLWFETYPEAFAN